MEYEVRIGGAQFTVLEVVPGTPDEGARVADVLRRLDPAVVGVDATLEDLRRDRESFYASLVRATLAAQGLRGRDVPALVARDHARRRDAEVVPLLGTTGRPGWWTRRAVTRDVSDLPPLNDPRRVAAGVRRAAADTHPDVARLLLAGERAMAAALRQLLVEEQRTRVVAVMTVPRPEKVVGLLLGKPVRDEVAAVAHGPS